MLFPDFPTELDTTTAMNDGKVAGGPELFPGLVDQVPPQLGGLVLVALAKPLKLGGACPFVIELSLDHWAPQNVTVSVAVRSPTTNEPWSRKAKSSVVVVAEDGR
jgi:hypothetical protein